MRATRRTRARRGGARRDRPAAGRVLRGERQSFDLPLALDGTAFQRRVWDALRGIGYGETVSYGQLADQIGRPTASRAVGLANGRNPVSIIVPCHRVVGSDGSLTGYGGGVANKQRLLDLERQISRSSADPERRASLGAAG